MMQNRGGRIKKTTTQLAEVVSVDTESWTVGVSTVTSNKFIPDVQIALPYCAPPVGAMIGAVPETGTFCYVTEADDGSYAYASNFIMAYNADEEYAGGRPTDLSPGDILFRTNSGNSIALKKGDVMVLSAGSGLASRTYLGKANAIRDVCRLYRLETTSGFIEMGTPTKAGGAGALTAPPSSLLELAGEDPAAFKIGIKRIESDVLPTLTIEMGNIANSVPKPDKGVTTTPVIKVELTLQQFQYLVDSLGAVYEKVLSKYLEATAFITLKAPIVNLGGELGESLVQSDFILGPTGTGVGSVFMNHTHPGDNQVVNPASVPLAAVSQVITTKTRAE
jgi:uncharacterized protein YjlB